MARVLFVVPPLTGHTNPTVSVGRELLRRGHAVAWCGYPSALTGVVPDGAALLPVADELPPDVVAAIEEKALGLRGAAALKFLWSDFIDPLGRAMLDGVEAAVRAFAPDVIVADQQAIAGAAVARRRGLPWATSATTSAELVNPLATMPKVDEWVRELLHDFQVDAGVPEHAIAASDVRFSEHLVLAFTTEALVGGGPYPDHYAFVGPSIADRPDDTSFPWEHVQGTQPVVLVSLGTLNAEAGDRFFGEAIDALAALPVRGVVVAPPERHPDVPPNVVVQARVPQLQLLPHVAAVVSHGGHNTVCESLAHGIPLVLAPIRDDQPIVADQVVRAGAGVRVKFGRVRSEELRGAIVQAMKDEPLRRGATAIQHSFARAGGSAAAADAIESLVPDPAPMRDDAPLETVFASSATT